MSTVRSKIGRDSIENIFYCVGDCKIDKRGICNGNYVCFENNHKKQQVTIMLGCHSTMGIKIFEVIKDEVWEPCECENWLILHGYKINRGCEQ